MDTQSLNFSEKYWRNPDKFDPSRFANGARPVPGSLFRFGMGPRKCLGYRYALAITRIVVASVLQRYNLQLANPDAARRVKTKGMTFFTPFLCPEIIFNERLKNIAWTLKSSSAHGRSDFFPEWFWFSWKSVKYSWIFFSLKRKMKNKSLKNHFPFIRVTGILGGLGNRAARLWCDYRLVKRNP